ncbi:metal-dependent hydrolase [Epibacterium ulvae]|uniref:metal-dependent hydrolase n=1 Tax=Epibacterium ulvae TaxID=1156985 RepID=UPI002493808D|nr:metal-dependent hydrolase [Epibacterium ulvae]
MLTAHLPSGYVLGRLGPQMRYGMAAALIGAVLPDFDMIWFLFVDEGRIHHHRYWVHIPLFWACIAAILLPVIALWWRHCLGVALIFFTAILLHLLLDTVSGGILWAVPFNDHLYHFITVPATQSSWVWSFILHWSFVAEITIWGGAYVLWRKARQA